MWIATTVLGYFVYTYLYSPSDSNLQKIFHFSYISPYTTFFTKKPLLFLESFYPNESTFLPYDGFVANLTKLAKEVLLRVNFQHES